MDNSVTPTASAASKADLSGFDQLKEKSLKSAGLAYLVGDAALVAAGVMEKNTSTALSGAFYGMGGLVLARYGNPHAEKRLQLLYHDVGDYLKKEGVTVPKGSKIDIAMLAQDHGVINHIERFLYKNPSQVLNALFAIGGVQLAHGGITQGRPWKTASGALVTAGALAGLLIPEKQNDTTHEHPNAGFFDKAKRWLQDKPLRASGYLYMANNATMGVDAFLHQRQHTGDNSHWLQYLNVASYVIANGLLATSLKNNTSSKNEAHERTAMEELERAAAEVIAVQPKEMQQALIQKMTGYLSAQGRVNIPAEELASAMQDVVNEHAQYIKPAKPEAWEDRINTPPQGSSSPAL